MKWCIILIITLLMASTVSAICWNPLEVFCLFGEDVEVMGEEKVKVNIIYQNTYTSCKENICTYTSLPQYIDSKGTRIKDAKSLLNTEFDTGIRCVVEYDGKHKAECLDFNYTHRLIDISLDDAGLVNLNIPIRVLKHNDTFDAVKFEEETKDMSISEKEALLKEQAYIKVSEVTERFSSTKDVKQMWIRADDKDIVEIGENSTTVTLITTGTQNMLDTKVHEDLPADTSDTDTALTINNCSNEQSFGLIKWNLSMISPSFEVVDANLRIFFGTNNLDAGECYEITPYKIISNWSVGATWNTKPDFDYNLFQERKTICNTGTQVILWNVTNIITQQDLVYGNVSFALVGNVTSGTPSCFDYVMFHSVEGVIDPLLNITYEAGASSQCDCPTINTNWIIDDGSQCLITSDCNIGTGRIYLTNGAFRVNDGTKVQATSCHTAPNMKIYTAPTGRLICGGT